MSFIVIENQTVSKIRSIKQNEMAKRNEKKMESKKIAIYTAHKASNSREKSNVQCSLVPFFLYLSLVHLPNWI